MRDWDDGGVGPEGDAVGDPDSREAEELPLPEYRHRWFVEENRDPLPCLFDAEGFPVILFAAVPLQRRRRHGWDEGNQRKFVDALARIPSITHACKLVGLSRRSLYTLIGKPEAQEFARAIDMALAYGRDRLKTAGLSRSLDGEDLVPVFRRGRHVRSELRRNDRLGIAILNAERRNADGLTRRAAQTRWRQQQEWAAADAERADQKPWTREEIERQVVEYIARERMKRPPPGPRIRSL